MFFASLLEPFWAILHDFDQNVWPKLTCMVLVFLYASVIFQIMMVKMQCHTLLVKLDDVAKKVPH